MTVASPRARVQPALTRPRRRPAPAVAPRHADAPPGAHAPRVRCAGSRGPAPAARAPRRPPPRPPAPRPTPGPGLEDASHRLGPRGAPAPARGCRAGPAGRRAPPRSRSPRSAPVRTSPRLPRTPRRRPRGQIPVPVPTTTATGTRHRPSSSPRTPGSRRGQLSGPRPPDGRAPRLRAGGDPSTGRAPGSDAPPRIHRASRDGQAPDGEMRPPSARPGPGRPRARSHPRATNPCHRTPTPRARGNRPLPAAGLPTAETRLDAPRWRPPPTAGRPPGTDRTARSRLARCADRRIARSIPPSPFRDPAGDPRTADRRQARDNGGRWCQQRT